MRFSLLSEVSIQSVTISFSFNNRKEVQHYRGNLVFEYFLSGSERRHHHNIYVQDKKEVRKISNHYTFLLPLPSANINAYLSLLAKCWLRGGGGGQFPRKV